MRKSSDPPRAYSYIRMSTQTQLLGDSLRRQLEASKKHAETQGWDLLEEDQLKDVGLSAFDGANLSEGALGKFLDGVRQGRVEPGSVLIIESLDRLSRQDPWKSMGLFSEIINAGVQITTLTDGRIYTVETGLGDLIFSIVDLSRAHEESRVKSQRLKSAWANKRKQAGLRKLTARCPGWLRLSADRESFEVIPQRAYVVNLIFEDSAAGIGNYSIARRLNDDNGFPTFGRSTRGWCTSSVAKILNSKAVLGEFQPHRIVNGRRVPDGEPISDYFPKIVSEELFYRAQNARIQRRVGGGGRRGAGVSNLFSGLAQCSYCNSPMVFVNKGRGPKGGTYLVCDSGRRGTGCFNVGWRYEEFEASFLKFIDVVDLPSLVHSESQDRRHTELNKEISALKGQLALVQEQLEQTLDLLPHVEAAASDVGRKLDELASDRSALTDALDKRKSEREELGTESSSFYESDEQIKLLLERFRDEVDGDTYKLRAQIAQRLGSLFVWISVASLGFGPIRDSAGEERQERDDKRSFSVMVKGTKESLIVYPSRNNPLEFDEDIVASIDD